MAGWIDQFVAAAAGLFPEGTHFSYLYNIQGLLAVLLVSVICGQVGSLVVGNRMAFFSDALAHCAFAGVALGFLTALAAGVAEHDFDQMVLPVMVVWGVLVGLAIAYVRERTGLASDTVIGVFFAGAMGLGAMLSKGVSRLSVKYSRIETFLFGNPLIVGTEDLLLLVLLAGATTVLLLFVYNPMVFASFNPSLARSRNVRVRLFNYAFIVLLGLIINLSLSTVGVLLISALLIVPAAAAANLSRNMRQLFWYTSAISVTVGAAGYYVSLVATVPLPGGQSAQFGAGGVIVLLAVICFFASMVLARRRRA